MRKKRSIFKRKRHKQAKTKLMNKKGRMAFIPKKGFH